MGLSRGSDDVRLYAVRHDPLEPRTNDDPGLPRLGNETREARDAVRDRLIADGEARPAIAHDDTALETVRLRIRHTLARLRALAVEHGPDSLAHRARTVERTATTKAATVTPSPEAIELLGPQPERGARRLVWDRTIGDLAVYRATHPDHTTGDAGAARRYDQPSTQLAQHRSQDRRPIPHR